MILKISNVRNPFTFEQLKTMEANYITINLDQLSGNYIGEIDPAILSVIPAQTMRCGRFATANTMQIISTAGKYNLDAVELFSDSATPKLCEQLSSEGIEVIRTFTPQQFHTIDKFEGLCNKFIFQTFIEEQIKIYNGNTPVLLSVSQIEANCIEDMGVLGEKTIVGYDINFNE